jgi:ribosomal protein S18 acetylase RimI-like enzyme
LTSSEGISILEVREAMPDELQVAQDLQERVLLLGGHEGRVQKSGSGVLMVAVVADRVVGAGRVLKGPGEDHAEIDCLAVDADFQRHGIGSELLAGLEGNAVRDGAHTTEVVTYDAADFYRRNGYTNIGKIVTRLGPQTQLAKHVFPEGSN